jgi:hypothetical protein
MSSVVHAEMGADHTEVPFVVRSAAKLVALEAIFVLAIAMVSQKLEGTVETVLLAVLVGAGVVLVTFLPGLWTRAQTIEGIAGAAGIGLAASWMFIVPDIAYQFAGVYTHRWRDIGGGSNWWHIPVWWMVGTYLPWFGAWILANVARRGGTPSLLAGAFPALMAAAVLGVVGTVLHFPGAGWNVPTFGLAFLPGLALTTLFTGLGARRK